MVQIVVLGCGGGEWWLGMNLGGVPGGEAWGGGGGADGGGAEEAQEWEPSNVAEALVASCVILISGVGFRFPTTPGVAHEFDDGGRRWGGPMHHLAPVLPRHVLGLQLLWLAGWEVLESFVSLICTHPDTGCCEIAFSADC